MKITVETSDKVRKLDCESAAIVTDRGQLISLNCGIDLMIIAAGVDIAFDNLLKVLKEKSQKSYEEIYSAIGDIKSKLIES